VFHIYVCVYFLTELFSLITGGDAVGLVLAIASTLVMNSV